MGLARAGCKALSEALAITFPRQAPCRWLGSGTKKFAQNGYCGIPYRRCALSILDFFSPDSGRRVQKYCGV